MKKTSKKNTKKTTPQPRFVDYHTDLLETLRNDRKGALIYLNDALKDEDHKMFFSALADVLEAYQADIKGLTKTKKATKKPRRTTPAVSKSINTTTRAPLHAKKR